MISDKDAQIIKKELASLSGPVKLINFTQELECQYCRETSTLIKQLAELSDKIAYEVYNFITDREATEKYKVDKIPATVFLDTQDRGIRFYGLPTGYEFLTVMETIKMLSRGQSGLSEQTKAFLQELKKPVHLQVFVTPTCPYCPQAVILAFKLAYESPLVTADAIEAIEFPHLANKYQVHGVPKTVINDSVHIEGAVPETALIESLRKAMVV